MLTKISNLMMMMMTTKSTREMKAMTRKRMRTRRVVRTSVAVMKTTTRTRRPAKSPERTSSFSASGSVVGNPQQMCHVFSKVCSFHEISYIL